MEEHETERLAEAIETAGTNIEKGLNNLAAAILEAATVYQFVQPVPEEGPGARRTGSPNRQTTGGTVAFICEAPGCSRHSSSQKRPVIAAVRLLHFVPLFRVECRTSQAATEPCGTISLPGRTWRSKRCRNGPRPAALTRPHSAPDTTTSPAAPRNRSWLLVPRTSLGPLRGRRGLNGRDQALGLAQAPENGGAAAGMVPAAAPACCCHG